MSQNILALLKGLETEEQLELLRGIIANLFGEENAEATLTSLVEALPAEYYKRLITLLDRAYHDSNEYLGVMKEPEWLTHLHQLGFPHPRMIRNSIVIPTLLQEYLGAYSLPCTLLLNMSSMPNLALIATDKTTFWFKKMAEGQHLVYKFYSYPTVNFLQALNTEATGKFNIFMKTHSWEALPEHTDSIPKALKRLLEMYQTAKS